MPEPSLDIFVRLKDLFTGNLKKVGTEVDKADKRITKGFGGMTKSAGALAGKLKAVAAAYVGWVAVQKLWDSAKDYAKLDAVSWAYERLSEQIGANTQSVGKWREAVKETVGKADVLKQVIIGMSSGLVQNEADFTIVSQAARVFARITGEDVLPKLQELTQQLSAASPEGLRKLGIDMEEVFRTQRKLTGTELPLETKQRLMLVELAKKLKGELWEIVTAEANLNEKRQQAEALWADSSENIGKAAQAMIDLNKETAKFWEKFTRERGEDVARGLHAITKNATEAANAVFQLAENLGRASAVVESWVTGGDDALTVGQNVTPDKNQWLYGNRPTDIKRRWRERQESPGFDLGTKQMENRLARIEERHAAARSAALRKMYTAMAKSLRGKISDRKGSTGRWKMEDRELAATQLWDEAQSWGQSFSDAWGTTGGESKETAAAETTKAQQVAESQQQLAVAYTSTAEIQEVSGERQIATMERILAASEMGVIQYQDNVGDALSAWSDTVVNLMGATETAIGSVFFDAMMGRMQSFKDYLRAWLSDIARAISSYMAKMFVGQLLGAGLNAAFGAIGGLFAGGTGIGTGSTPQAMGGANTFNDSIMSAPAMPGFFAKGYGAEGGIASEPGYYGLAERGQPEGIVPLTRNRAIPVELKGGGRNVTVIYAPRVSAIDQDGVARFFHQNQDALLAPVYQALGNNPTFRSAVGGAVRGV